MFILNKYD